MIDGGALDIGCRHAFFIAASGRGDRDRRRYRQRRAARFGNDRLCTCEISDAAQGPLRRIDGRSKQIRFFRLEFFCLFDHAAIPDAFARDRSMLFGCHWRRCHQLLEARHVGIVALGMCVQNACLHIRIPVNIRRSPSGLKHFILPFKNIFLMQRIV